MHQFMNNINIYLESPWSIELNDPAISQHN